MHLIITTTGDSSLAKHLISNRVVHENAFRPEHSGSAAFDQGAAHPSALASLQQALQCRRGRFRLVVLGIITTATAVLLVFNEPGGSNPVATYLIFSGLGFSVVMWFVALFKRRAAKCPLCKGTPLINSGALAHSRAKRIYPLDHGVSAVISILATQKFRCMYCGSDFDLLKTPSHLRRPQENRAEKPLA